MRIRSLTAALTAALVLGGLALAPSAFGATGPLPKDFYPAGSQLNLRVDGANAVVDSARTTAFRNFMATNADQKGTPYPKLNLNDKWAMSYDFGTSADPVWKLTGSKVTGNAKLAILAKQGFHMADSVADSFPTGTQDRPGVIFDEVFGYTVLFADAVPNKATRTIAVSSAGITWHGSNGLDYRNPASNDSRNFQSRGRLADAMVVTREELDAAVAAGTGVGKVLHLFFVETNGLESPCFVSPMVGCENDQRGWGREGERLRLNPAIDLKARGLTGYPLALAKTMQENGVYLGDNSGSVTQVKMSQTSHYTGTGLTASVFSGKLTWADFQSVRVP